MSRPQFEQGLQKWIETVLAPLGFSPTINVDQGKPRAIPPFASLRILSSVSIGQDERSTTYDSEEDEITNTIKDRTEGTVTVSIYGDGHDTAAHALKTIHQDAMDLLSSYGVSISYDLGIQRLGVDSDGVTENRSIIDFVFRWVYINEQISTDWIETAVITEV